MPEETDLFGNVISVRAKRIAICGRFVKDNENKYDYQAKHIDPILEKLGLEVYYFKTGRGKKPVVSDVDYILYAPIHESEDEDIKYETYMKHHNPIVISTREDFDRLAAGEI